MIVTRRAFLRAGVAAGVAAGGAGAYGFAYERHHLGVTRVTVTVTGLPAPLDGLRIGVLTDLHRSALVSQQAVLDAARLLMAQQPDLIALLGDYVSWSDRRYLGSCVEALAPLSAPRGVVAVLGNHDDERATAKAFAARGFVVLADARTELRIANETIDVAGVRYWTRRPRDVRRVLGGARRPTILLSHDPRRLAEAADMRVPLVLSGHTHGGQIVLPLVGALGPEKFPVLQGVLSRGSTTLFVSRGVGTVLVPVRLNCPPEVAVVTVKARYNHACPS